MSLMRWFWLVAGLVLAAMVGVIVAANLAVSARAQEVSAEAKVPGFVPFVVDQRNYEAVRKHLEGLSYRDAQPVINWMDSLAAKAKEQWAAENAPKAAEGAK